MKTIPSHLTNDRYWKSLLFLFSNHPKLNKVFTTKYIDIEAERIKIDALKQVSKPWSSSEKSMLALALHLFNENNKFNLSDLDNFDSSNKALAFKAIQIRFF